MTMVVVHLGDRYLTCFMQNLATGSGQKWLKLKQSRKPHICGIRGLRVNHFFAVQLILHFILYSLKMNFCIS